MTPSTPESHPHVDPALLAALRESVRRFAQDQIAPLARRIDREDWFARELWPRMGELGILGPTVSEGDGGPGLNYQAHAVIAEEISRVSGSVGISYVAHSNLCVTKSSATAHPSKNAATSPPCSAEKPWARLP